MVPFSQVKSTLPVLKSPANRHKAVGLSLDQWQYAFTNTFSDEESEALYERYHIPANGGILWGSVLANLKPGPQETLGRLPERQPAHRCCSSPAATTTSCRPSIQHSNVKHYKSEHGHRGRRVSRARTCFPPGRLGGGRGRRARLGRGRTRG